MASPKFISAQVAMTSGHSVRRRTPLNLLQEEDVLFQPQFETFIPPAFLWQLSQVQITGKGLLFQGGRLLAESYASPKDFTWWKRRRREWKFWATRPLRTQSTCSDPALWITDNWSAGYFHWLTDALPRLLAAGDVARNSRLLLPGEMQRLPFVEASLKPFKLAGVQYIQPQEVCRCSNLWLPTHTAPTGNYQEELIQRLRSILVESFGNHLTPRSHDRIYISRGRAARRKIVNEAEVQRVLESHGFQTIYCEDLSFEEQVHTISSANYLISNHGAGLTNMLFMQPGRSVLELRRRGKVGNNCYFSLASALALNYFYQTCSAESDAVSPHVADLIVDLSELEKNLARMLGN